MAEIRLPKVSIPYRKESDLSLFDPTKEDAPDQVNHVLTRRDLKSFVKPPSLQEVVFADGKERVMDDLNRMMVLALRSRVFFFGAVHGSELLKNREIGIAATSEEAVVFAEQLASLVDDREKFIAYLAGSDKMEPFVMQIFDALLKTGRIIVAGEIFHKMVDEEKQKTVLLHMKNVFAAAQMLCAAEKISGQPDFYTARFNRWVQDTRLIPIMVAESEMMFQPPPFLNKEEKKEETFLTPVPERALSLISRYESTFQEIRIQFKGIYENAMTMAEESAIRKNILETEMYMGIARASALGATVEFDEAWSMAIHAHLAE
ncbi:MAG: hypothetical protein Q7T03_10445 [Deltaproteobacteria bacterium]|nr:hypothetical protein [Deltaproteobacteria bacterium]